MGKRNRDLDLRVVSVCVSKSLNFLSYFLSLSFSFFLLLLPLATIVMQCEVANVVRFDLVLFLF